MSSDNKKDTNCKESELIESVLAKAMFESRLKTIFNFLLLTLMFTYIGFIVYQSKFASASKAEKPYFAVINIDGEISSANHNNAHQRIQLLEQAFADDMTEAVILKLNSGGGSPSHSKLIYDRINQLKKTTGKKVYGFVEDVCASGCYYIASAADELYATPVSYVGSIGVKMPSWDATSLLDKLGVKNDTLSAGDNKLLLSPFHKKDDSTIEFVESNLLKPIHQQFITDVKSGREALSKHDDSHEVFSGLIWAGNDAVEMGLVDGLQSMYELRENTEGKPIFVNYEPKINVFKKMFSNIAIGLAESVIESQQNHTPSF